MSRFLVAVTVMGTGFFAAVAQGQTNAGPISVTNNPVWDITGNETNISFTVGNRNETVSATANSVALQEFASGRVTVGANNSTTVQLTLSGALPASATFTATDKVSGSISSSTTGKGHAQVSITLSGTADLPDRHGNVAPRKVTASQSISATFDDSSQAITGTERDSASAAGLGSASGHQAITDTLPNVFHGNGSWTLTFANLVLSGKKVTGTATVILYSGTTFNYAVHGTVSSKGTKLMLVGGPDALSKGSTLLVSEDDTGAITEIKGKIAGQSVDVSL
jgi:hypothetical protein